MTMTRTGMGIRLALLAAAITLLGNLPAMGTNLFWSANGTTQGGAGTWDTTVAHWDTTSTGPFLTIWNNANADSAEFGGTAGVVNLGGPITVHTIQTDVSGFTFGNGNGVGNAANDLFFAAGGGVNATHTSGTTTLTARLNGTLNKTGPGRVEINNTANLATTRYVVTGGALTMPASSRFGTAPGSLVSDFVTLDGGGWGFNTTTSGITWGANRGITITANNGFLSTSAGTVLVTLDAPIVGTAGGGLTVGGVPSVWAGTAHTAGGVWTLTNTGNSWNGNLTINGASGTIVRAGAAGVIPDTALVTLSAAGNQFQLGDPAGATFFNETVKSIAGTAGTVAVGSASLTIDNPNGETYSSVFTAIAGGKVIKNGAGTWILSGSSTGFNGEFVMNTGTLGVGGSNIFGNTSNTSSVTYNGGTLSNTGTGGRTIASPIPLAINANMTVDDSLFNTSAPGQILFNGPATIAADRTFTVNGTANLGLADLRESGGVRNVIKAGNGTLALTGVAPANAAVFTGTVTVNAGRLQVSGASIVGNESNTVILNGGALNTSATRTVNFANPISVIANSAITTSSTAATPNFDFSNDNPLTFTGGTVLTLRNDGGDAATDQLRVRFFGGGFNIANSIDMPNGAASSIVELSSFNTNSQAAQTFSGVITGTGNFKRSASTSDAGNGGTTIMAAQHTFTGGTKLNDGTIEFAVDSVGPANAPTSGPVGTGTITVDNINSPKLAANGGARNVGNSIAFAGGSVMGITGSNNLTLTGDVNLGAGARTINVDNSGQSLLSGTISGTGGSLTKALGGVLTVSGNNTYDTGTTVGAGTLLVNNTTGSGTGTGAMTVNSGATLGGTGTVGGAITNNGTIAPGAGVGTLSVTGDVTDAAASNWAIELSGASADKLAVNGNIDLTAADSLVVTGAGSGGSWLIGTYTGILSGVFDTITSGYTVDYSGGNITLNAAVAGLLGDFNSDGKVDASDYVTWRKNDTANLALPNDNAAGNQAARYTLWQTNFGNPPGAGSGDGLGSAAVPEPSAIILLAIGLFAAAIRRRG